MWCNETVHYFIQRVAEFLIYNMHAKRLRKRHLRFCQTIYVAVRLRCGAVKLSEVVLEKIPCKKIYYYSPEQDAAVRKGVDDYGLDFERIKDENKDLFEGRKVRSLSYRFSTLEPRKYQELKAATQKTPRPNRDPQTTSTSTSTSSKTSTIANLSKSQGLAVSKRGRIRKASRRGFEQESAAGAPNFYTRGCRGRYAGQGGLAATHAAAAAAVRAPTPRTSPTRGATPAS